MEYGVRAEKVRALMQRMEALGISEADIDERFIQCAGKGGQKANKSASGVYLSHRPSGRSVKYTKERSRALNRYYARKILILQIETAYYGEESEEKQREEKIRKQKARRKRRGRRQDDGSADA